MTFALTQLCTVRLHRWALGALIPLLLLTACATPPAPIGAPTSNAAPPITAPGSDASTAPNSAAALVGAASSADTATPAIALDPLNPGVRINLDDRSARTDLWARVRAGFAMPDLNSELVRNREQWYAARPDYVQRMTERGGRYLFHIVEELDRRGMPTELALLPFIESAYNPQAMSSAKASGMWQFMPATGKDFALKQNVFRDDRRDVLASTRAALDYMQKLYGMFGDWHLALAAYNWGEGSVQRAVARNQKLGLPTDYASLKMPNETQYYVPKLQAVKNIVARPADFGLTLPPLQNHPYFVSVPIDRDMDVAVAVRLAGMSSEEFQTLNPQMNKPVILAAGTSQVLLPYDNANQFVHQLPLHRGQLASWTAWVAPRTLRPSDAAAQVGMSEAQLREVNRIPPHMLVRSGSTLLVPRGEHRQTDVPMSIADNAIMALAPDAPLLRKVSVKAGRKETVDSLAKRYRVNATQVAQWNNVGPTATFKPGQTVVVYVAPKAKSKSAPTLARGKAGHRPPAVTAATLPRQATGKPAQAARAAPPARVPRG